MMKKARYDLNGDKKLISDMIGHEDIILNKQQQHSVP